MDNKEHRHRGGADDRVHCETAEEAVAEYISLYPNWTEDELYASEANWND